MEDHFPRNSERRRWQEETRAGALTKLLPPLDEAAELAEAKRLREHREYSYDTEPPSLRTFLMAVRHSGPRGVTITGTSQEVAGILRNVGIPVIVAQEYQPPALAGGPQVKRT